MDYNDGLANEVQTWDYDAAGNRISASANPGTWTYDNLNRMSASPGVTYTHDMVGNRLTKVVGSNSTSYGWDAVNRMTGYSKPGLGQSYKYRADGMRVWKGGSTASTRTYYDGQMPTEEDVTTGGSTTLTRNFVGARGIEAMFTTANNATTASYPLYDTHGNMIATLSKNSAGTSWSVGDERSYDVWGGVRSGAATGGPKGRYVANLGHVQDDESGLIYMRARYYEPGTGRFVSQDVARQGLNWFTYCANDPVNKVDSTGKYWWLVLGLALVGALAGMAAYAVYQQQYGDPITPGGLAAAAVGGAFAGVCAGLIALTAGVASAAAAGALILEAIAVGVVSVAAAALCGKMAGAIDGKKVAMSFSPIDHAVACIMGYQFLLAAEMSGE